MHVALITIGVPGSGKTTLARPLSERFNLAYINKDEIREELTGNALNRSRNKEVWEEANRRTREALQSGQGVVLDNTMAEAWKRKELVTFLRSCGASPIVALYFPIDPVIAKTRNASRSRQVPESAIDWMQEQLRNEPPQLSEGYDYFFTIDELDRVEELLQSL